MDSQLNGTNGPSAARVSPAAHLAEKMAVRSAGRVALRELAFRPQVGLRAAPGSASAVSLEGVLGVPLPSRVGEVTGDPLGLHVLWLAPDEFLAVDVSREQRPGEARALDAGLAGLPGQAVDLSANRTILELMGPDARGVLEKGCGADLHPRAFPVNAAIMTQLAQVPVILHRSAPESYRLYPRASFADYTVRWLLDAMREFVDSHA